VTLSELFSDEDYPVSAIRAGEQGAVGFRLEVGPDGGVAVCTVTISSGSPILDSTTCRLLRSRARFLPALDRKGRPTVDSHSGRIIWRLPEPEPESQPPPTE
jgi:protein TonB